MDSNLERQIVAASRSVEEVRRLAYRDPARIGQLVEQISVLADLRQKEGDFRKAESLYREALYRAQELKKPDPELLCGIHSLLAHLYDRWGRMDKAAEYYEKALQIAEDASLHDNDKVATIKNNLAMIFKQARDYKKAERYYNEALETFRNSDGEESPRVASVLNNLGVLYYTNMDVDRAQQMHEKALGIRQSLAYDQIDPADLSQTYINLGAVYKAIGDFQKAEACVDRARSIRAGMNGYHPTPRRAASLLIDKT
ncbi:MAG: tetratricopeptide repeat protein [Prosthecobacter sp.]|nr:tetratricopeptide repeat protein [Prosthecobacter sp.]